MNTLFEFCETVNKFGYDAHIYAGFNRGDDVLPAYWDVSFTNRSDGRFAAAVYVGPGRVAGMHTTSFGSLYNEDLTAYVAEVVRGSQLVEFLNGLEIPGRNDCRGLKVLYFSHLLTYGAKVPAGNVFKCSYDD